LTRRRPRLCIISIVATAAALLLVLPPVAGADPLGDQFRISNQGPDGDAAFDAERPDIAYNPQTGQSLVVWVGTEATSPSTTYEIYGQLIDGNGDPVGGDFPISGDGHPDAEDPFEPPSVTYNPEDNEFLVVWNVDDISGTIFVQRVSATGAELGTDDLQISSDNYDDIETTDVSYSPEADRYLAIWKADGASGQQLYGRLLNRDGSPIGPGDFAVSQQTGEVDDAISVAYNPRDQEWLTVWRRFDPVGEYEVYGQRVNTGGTEVGPNDFRISDVGPDGDTTFETTSPRVAYNSVSNEYLVSWSGDDDTPPLVNDEYEVRGQRLAADGSEVGANDFRISDMGPDGNASFFTGRPDIAYNPNANEYVLTWHGDDDTPPFVDEEFEIFGQRLAASGAEIGTNDFRVTQVGPDGDANFDNNRPVVAYNARTCDYVAAWGGETNTGGLVDNEFEIWGRRIAAPACVPPPAPPAPPAPPGPNPGACANPKTGTNASETINGTAFGDLISGLRGNDIINGLQGDDCLNGNAGSDRLSGASGRDTLSGGAGNDRLSGGSANDRLSGGTGRDRLSGGSGSDRLSGGVGKDRLSGGRGTDRLSGGSGNDRISGGSGKNIYSAGGGNDAVNSANGKRERVNCGKGKEDRARADTNDRLRGCEIVTRV